MSSPETASATGPSLVQDWLAALRYWLRGRRGVIGLLVLVALAGLALNWSWLVAAGIAPLLLTALPCALMCGLGLCMSRTGGGSCSTSASTSEDDRVPMPSPTQGIAAAEPVEAASASPVSAARRLPDPPSLGGTGTAPDPRPQVLHERE